MDARLIGGERVSRKAADKPYRYLIHVY